MHGVEMFVDLPHAHVTHGQVPLFKPDQNW